MIQPIREALSPRGMIILGCCLIVSAFELLVHWYMSKSYPFSSDLLHWYIYRDPVSNKGVAGNLDSLLPAVVLGVLIGWVGWRWSVDTLALFAVSVGAGIVALEPAYAIFLGRNQMWWLPRTSGDVISFIIREGGFWIVGLCIFTYGGRRFGEYYSRPKT
jgi:hypothetical protein